VLNETLDGLAPGVLYLLAGDPGAGKSSFAKQIFDQVIDKEKGNCLFVTYNLSRRQLSCKTIARLAGVSCKQLNRGDLPDADWQKAAKVGKYIKEKAGERIFILEADENVPAAGIDKAIEKANAGFVVVDNLQSIPAPGRNNAYEVQPPAAANLAMLKRICRKRQIPIIVISNGATTPEVQYHSDVILNLTARVSPQVASSDKQPYIVMLSVEKNIEGISKTSIQYTFFPPRMTFYGEKKTEAKPAGT
jgi:replicative DNA helicase